MVRPCGLIELYIVVLYCCIKGVLLLKLLLSLEMKSTAIFFFLYQLVKRVLSLMMSWQPKTASHSMLGGRYNYFFAATTKSSTKRRSRCSTHDDEATEAYIQQHCMIPISLPHTYLAATSLPSSLPLLGLHSTTATRPASTPEPSGRILLQEVSLSSLPCPCPCPCSPPCRCH